MLKIKDSVNLKELEKFGFEYDNFNETYDKEISDNTTLFVYEGSNRLYVMTSEFYPDCGVSEYEENTYEDYVSLYEIEFDIINDLIKADLVEKVEE